MARNATEHGLSSLDETRRRLEEEAARRAQEAAEKAREIAAKQAENAAAESANAVTEQTQTAASAEQPEPQTQTDSANVNIPDPAHTGVRSEGLPRAEQEDINKTDFIGDVRTSVLDTQFGVVGGNYIAPEYKDFMSREDQIEHYASRMAGYAAGMGGEEERGLGNTINVNRDSFKDAKQAVLFSTTMNDDKNRYKLLTDYADNIGVDPIAFIVEAEKWMKTTYNRDLFSVPQTDGGKISAANKALGSVGLTNAAGEALDILKATPQMVIQSLYMNPDSGVHEDAWKAIQVLQKTPGNAWYGMELTKSDLAFKDSADLTKKKYDEEVSAMAEGFSFAEKPTEQNNRTYGEMLRDIQTDYGDNPRVYGYMKAALDKTYTDLNNGYMPPQEDEVLKWLDDLEREGLAGEQTDPETGKTSFKIFGGDTDAVSGATVVPAFETYKKEKDGTIDKLDAINKEAENAGKDALGGLITVGKDGKTVLHGTFGDEEIGTVTPSGGGAGTPVASNTVEVGGSEPVWLMGNKTTGGIQIDNGKVVVRSAIHEAASGRPGAQEAISFMTDDMWAQVDELQSQLDAGKTEITNPFAGKTVSRSQAKHTSANLPEPRYVASAFTSDVIPPSAYFSAPRKEEAPVSAAFNPANLPPELLEKYKKTGEVQGAPWIPPVIRNAVDVLANADRPSAEINEIVPYDPDMTDAEAMTLFYSGRELDARNKAQIAEVTGDRQSMDMLDAIYNTNATRGGVAVSRQTKYGNRIGSAMDSLSTGELDAESVNNGFFILNDVRRQINAMIENEGSIIVPYGVNQYDYILERQPALMEKVSFVEGMLDQFNDAKTLAKQEAAKEHQAITDQYMADMQAGHGTPDKAAWLALEDVGGKDPGMAWMEDPTYNAFLDDTTRNGRIFAGKALFGGGTVIGEFWNGDSVAAKAARRLETDSTKDAAMEMRAETNEAAQELLAMMCQDAYQNGMSLDAWFERAGITSVDQLADIAYKNSVRTGNILKNNPQAQQALDTINSTFGNAVALGWNTAMAQSTAGTLETTQILTDKLLHEGNRITIRDKMWESYDDQAPKMARRKLYGLLNGTDLSDESKTELKARLDSNEDIFNITADYIDLDGLQAWLHTKTNDKQKEAEDLALIGSFLGGWDKKFYTAANMVGGAASYWAKSALGTLATGNPLAGAMIAGYGGIGDNYERYVEKNATEGEAWFMALSHWLVEAKLNSGGNQSVLDDMLAGEGYTDDLFHALKNGRQNGFATALTTAKYMGVHGVKRYGREGMEGAGEVISDRALEMLFDVYDQENEALKNGEGMSVSRLFDTMLGTIEAVDPYEFGVEMLTNFNAEGVMGFFTGIGGSLRLTSAAFGDYRALKNYKSVQMMQQLYDGDIPGTEENIGLICQQMRLDLRDPRYRSWLDGQSKARRDLKNFGVAVSEGTAIEERSAAAELATETKELEGRRDAAESAMTEAGAAYDDLTQRVANGEVDQIPAMEAAQTAYSRASQTYNELAEAARKKGAKAAEAAKKWMDLALSATQEIGAEDLKQSIDRWTAQTFEIARTLYEKQQANENAAKHEAWLEETFDMAHEMQDEEQAATQAQEMADYEAGQLTKEEARLTEEAELEAQVDAEAEEQAQAEQLAAEKEIVAQMTDEEIDAEIAAITENETRTAEAEAQSGEMGYDEETIAALKEQTDTQAEAKEARKQAIVLNQREQYKSLTERIEEAAQLDDADAEAELLKQRQAVQARIEALGAQIEDPEANAPEPTTDVRPAMPQAEADLKAQAQTGGENAPEPSTQSTPAKPVQKSDPRKEANHARIMERAADLATGTTKAERDAAKAVTDAQKAEMRLEERIKQKQAEAMAAMESGDMVLCNQLLDEAGLMQIELEAMQERGAQEAADIADAVTGNLAEQEAQAESGTASVLEATESRKALEEERRTLKDVFSSLTNTPLFVNASQLANMLYETGAKTLTELNKMLGMKLTQNPDKSIPLDSGWYQELKSLAPGYFRDDWDEHPEEALVALGQRKKAIGVEIAQAKAKEAEALEVYERNQAANASGAANTARAVPPGHALSQFENKTLPKSDVSTPGTNKALEGTTHEVHKQNELKAKAKREIAQNGLTKTFGRLITLDSMTDQDMETAYQCLEIFKNNGDIIKHAMLAAKVGKARTRIAQALRTTLGKTETVVQEVVEMADAYNRKKGRYKSVNVSEDADAQLSLGETKAQPFMEAAVSRATSDPAGQKLGSDVAKRSGLQVYWANLPEGMRGFFDRVRGVIVLSQKIGAAQGAYITAIHEFTHHMESAPGYKQYADAVLKAAYGENYTDSDARLADEAAIRDEYAQRGQGLTDELLEKELVAAATEKILLGDEAFMRTLFESGNGPAAVRILGGIDDFLRKDKAKKAGKEALERYNLLKTARSEMKNAVRNAGKWKAGQTGEAQAAIKIDRRGIPYVEVEEDILAGLPENEWAKAADTALRKFKKGIPVGKNTIHVSGKTRGEWTHASNTRRIQREEPAVYADKMRSANNADEIVWASTDYVNEDATHDRTDGITEFGRGNVNISIAGRDYKAEVLIGLRRDKSLVLYDVTHIKPQTIQKKTPQNNAGSSKGIPNRPSAASDIIIYRDDSDVKNQSMQNAPQASIQVEHHQDSKGNRQQSIMDRDTYDKLGMTLPDGDLAMQEQPDTEQLRIEEKKQIGETTRKVLANIDALNAQEDVSYDNPWKVGINPFQRKQIAKYGLENVKLPGLNYSRATIEQRMLCAVLSTPQDNRGKGVMTLSEQLAELNKKRRNPFASALAVVTNADYAYILAQAAIVEESEVDENGIPVTEEGKQAYARLLDAQANIQPVSVSEKANAWRFISMLSSPVTTVKNISGNQIAQEADRISKAGIVWLDKMIAKKTGTRALDNATRAERKEGSQAAIQRGRNAFNDYFVAKANTSRSRNYEIGGDGRVFETEALEFARNLIGFAMDAPDQMYMEKAIVEEAAALKRIEAKIRDEETSEMRTMTDREIAEEAYRRASNRFYHDSNAMTNILGSLYQVPFIGTAARVLIPFAKTPSNVAIRMFEYSPLGLAKSVFYDGLYQMNHNKAEDGVGVGFDQYKFVMGVGRGMTGTALCVVGGLLLKAGILEFGREDEENGNRRDVKAALGEPYGLYVNIGGTKHEISFAQPIAAALSIGAGFADRMDDEDFLGLMGGVLADMGNTFFNNSYLSSLNDLFKGYKDGWGVIEGIAAQTATSYVSQMFSPALFRAMAKSMDTYARDTYSSKGAREFLNKQIIQNWPILRQTLPIRTDMTGDKMTQHRTYQEMESWAGNVLNFVDSFLSPTATYSDKDDPQLIELLDLSYRTGETAFLPPAAFAEKNTVKVNKTLAKKMKAGDAAFSVSLTDEQQRAVNQMYSTILFNGVGKMRYKMPGSAIKSYEIRGLRSLMESGEWAQMKDDDRIKEVDAMKSMVKELVTVYVVENYQ